jgi:hypothetical protein
MIFLMKVKFLNKWKQHETFKSVIIEFVIMQMSISNFGNIIDIFVKFI